MSPRLTGTAVALTLTLTGIGAASQLTIAAASGWSGIAPPVASGHLRIAGDLRDGGTVFASGLNWRPARLPAGYRLLSFEVAYTWQSCAKKGCRPGADSTVTPFAARRYVVGHPDASRRLRVTETAAEVVQTRARDFTFKVLRARRSFTTSSAVRTYPSGRAPVSAFVNGLPESRTGSDAEYFQVSLPHFSKADGQPTQQYQVDRGHWQALPKRRVFFTGKLGLGQHRVVVRTRNSAGRTSVSFSWRVIRLPAPWRCTGSCWYPPHLDSAGRPLRWDWQIGRTFPKQRTGRRAVDFYDIDGFLTTRAQVHAIHATWQASTLRHPKAACYLDLAWEDYRGDGGLFPAAALGNVYYGYPEERWVDFRQLDALKPMLRERIAMCARKGFDSVELDDIDSFDPPFTTGFDLTAGDAQNYLAYAFNLVHSYGMTALWKNSPELARWGARYTEGAVLEECYLYQQCGSWHVFTADKTAAQPTGKWVGEAEYGADHFVCDPGQGGSRCQGRHSYAAFCRTVYGGPDGFSAVKFDVDLDGRIFYPCPAGA